MTSDSPGTSGPEERRTSAPATGSEGKSSSLSEQRANIEIQKSVAKLRRKGMKHRAVASSYLLKSKRADEKAAQLLRKANEMRKEADALTEDARKKETRATEMQKENEAGKEGQNSSDAADYQVRYSKLEHERAKLARKASQLHAKAARLTEKATKLKRRSVDYLERQRKEEAHSAKFLNRADEMEKKVR